MIPFPFLRHNNEEKYEFVSVLIKQVNKSSEYRYGYYRVENNMLIGENGQISIEEFMKETVRVLKNRKIDLKQCVENPYSGSLLFYQTPCVSDEYLRENRIIQITEYKISFLDFFSHSIKYFLSREDFFRLTPYLLFDNEQYVDMDITV